MAISQLYAVTATIGTTEWSLTTNTSGPDADTTDGVFQVFIDTSAVAAGDVFEVRLYEKVQAASTQRLVDSWFIDGPQSKPNWATPSFILMHGWDVTIKKISGTDRSISASVRQVA